MLSLLIPFVLGLGFGGICLICGKKEKPRTWPIYGFAICMAITFIIMCVCVNSLITGPSEAKEIKNEHTLYTSYIETGGELTDDMKIRIEQINRTIENHQRNLKSPFFSLIANNDIASLSFINYEGYAYGN